MSTIKFKRGLEANVSALTLQGGEPAFTTDGKNLYIGIDGTTAKQKINISSAVTSVNTRTGDVVLTSSDVGLGNVANETKATMFTSPTFTGTVTAPTPTTADNSTKVATTAYVQAQSYIKSTDVIDGGTF